MNSKAYRLSSMGLLGDLVQVAANAIKLLHHGIVIRGRRVLGNHVIDEMSDIGFPGKPGTLYPFGQILRLFSVHDESRKQNWSSTPEYKEYVLTTCFNHLDIVFNVSLKDYLHLCVLNYFSGMTVFESNGTNKQHSSKHMYNLDEITSAMAECVEFYYSQKDILAEKLSEMVSNTDKFSSCYQR